MAMVCVNIQDLVIVANALDKAEPDLNGDGVVNILDLVIVSGMLLAILSVKAITRYIFVNLERRGIESF